MLHESNKFARIGLGVVEFVPLMLFVYADRFGADLAERFFWGAGPALMVMPVLLVFRWPMNPILVGTNIWLCLEALSFLVYIEPLVEVLQFLRETALFLTLILVGATYHLLSPSGFVGVGFGDRALVRRYSMYLLAIAAGGTVFSVLFRGNEMISAVLPHIALLLARTLMTRRLSETAAG